MVDSVARAVVLCAVVGGLGLAAGGMYAGYWLFFEWEDAGRNVIFTWWLALKMIMVVPAIGAKVAWEGRKLWRELSAGGQAGPVRIG